MLIARRAHTAAYIEPPRQKRYIKLRICDFGRASAAAELASYFADSFGNATRIDYGTGHETTFVALLYCLVHPCSHRSVVRSACICVSRAPRLLNTRLSCQLLAERWPMARWLLRPSAASPMLMPAPLLIPQDDQGDEAEPA